MARASGLGDDDLAPAALLVAEVHRDRVSLCRVIVQRLTGR
jgi:hypothetical protein